MFARKVKNRSGSISVQIIRKDQGRYRVVQTVGTAQGPDEIERLWQIEKAFRISKTDLRIRPIYHYRRRRIEAHLCIAFAAYAIYKELERLLKKKSLPLSAQRAGELTRNIYELHYTLPDCHEPGRMLLKMDEE